MCNPALRDLPQVARIQGLMCVASVPSELQHSLRKLGLLCVREDGKEAHCGQSVGGTVGLKSVSRSWRGKKELSSIIILYRRVCFAGTQLEGPQEFIDIRGLVQRMGSRTRSIEMGRVLELGAMLEEYEGF